jgi:hypothetical protein
MPGSIVEARPFALLQVCVPEDWDDTAILEYAESKYPFGVKGGWKIEENRVRCKAYVTHYHVLLVL